MIEMTSIFVRTVANTAKCEDCLFGCKHFSSGKYACEDLKDYPGEILRNWDFCEAEEHSGRRWGRN
jgi:hypothetical protein